jgi:hypothetical protein
MRWDDMGYTGRGMAHRLIGSSGDPVIRKANSLTIGRRRLILRDGFALIPEILETFFARNRIYPKKLCIALCPGSLKTKRIFIFNI